MQFFSVCVLASAAAAMVIERVPPAQPRITVTDFFARHVPGTAIERIHFNVEGVEVGVPKTFCDITFACAGTELCKIEYPEVGKCAFNGGHIEFYLEDEGSYPLGKWQLNVQTYSSVGHYGFSRSISNKYDLFVENPKGSGFTYEVLRVPGRTFTASGTEQPA